MDPLPLVVVSPPSPERERFLAGAPGASLEILDSAEAFLSREGEEWGVLLLGPGLSDPEVLGLLRAQRDRATPWVTLMVEEEDGGHLARPISLGVPLGLAAVVEKAGAPEEKGPILDLFWILRFVARARHDLNNPLTSGLAEVQLLLMDEQPPEVRDSLETIQEQFRRLRDMVAGLGRLRVPRRDPVG